MLKFKAYIKACLLYDHQYKGIRLDTDAFANQARNVSEICKIKYFLFRDYPCKVSSRLRASRKIFNCISNKKKRENAIRAHVTLKFNERL